MLQRSRCCCWLLVDPKITSGPIFHERRRKIVWWSVRNMTDKQTSRGDKGQSSHKQTTRSVCPLNHSTLLSHDPSCPSSLPRPPPTLPHYLAASASGRKFVLQVFTSLHPVRNRYKAACCVWRIWQGTLSNYLDSRFVLYEKERSKNKSDMIDFFRLRSNLNLNRAGPGMSESVLCNV